MPLFKSEQSSTSRVAYDRWVRIVTCGITETKFTRSHALILRALRRLVVRNLWLEGWRVLALLRELRMPIVTTLHTVLSAPNPAQRR